jgi:hypothetical protein
MRHFLQYMTKIPADYLPRIEQSITKAVEVLSDPSATTESYSAIAKELAEIQTQVGEGAAKAWAGEVGERLKADWIKAGRNGIDLEQQVTPKITQVLKTAEKLRKAHWSLTAVAEVICGLGALAVAVFGVLSGIWTNIRSDSSGIAPSHTQTEGRPTRLAERERWFRFSVQRSAVG